MIKIQTMLGLGDCIYSRPFIKALTDGRRILLQTPWVELFSDLDVQFVKPVTSLRTQSKSIARFSGWVKSPEGRRVAYSANDVIAYDMFYGLEKSAGVRPVDMDLPLFDSPIQSEKPICVIRPVTLRTEWLAESRNPLAEYIYQAAEIAMQNYHVIVVADIDDVNERLVGRMPPAHEYFIRGELSTGELIGLIQGAALVVGGVGWIVPACIAAKTKLVCVLGGQGGYNAPERITNPRMDLSRVRFIKPDNYCLCTNKAHGCGKIITGFQNKFNEALRGFNGI